MELFTELLDQQQEGCSGGGLETEASYPYTASPGVELYIWSQGKFVDAEEATLKGKKTGWLGALFDPGAGIPGEGLSYYCGPKGQVKKLTRGGGSGLGVLAWALTPM